MAHRKPLERRTFLQDRFEILIKRQQDGTASFNELTELDDIVNRDPALREKVIRESILMEDIVQPGDDPNQADPMLAPGPVQSLRQNVFGRIRAFLNRVFLSKTFASKQGLPALRQVRIMMI